MTDVRTAKTAGDLRAITELVEDRREHGRPSLLGQAVHLARARVDRSPLPGGAAMVALGPVADLQVWEARAAVSERVGVPTREVRTAVDLEDPDDQWPPLQVLRYWTDTWREQAHQRTDHPTLATEAGWLRGQLDAIHDRLTTAEWRAFADSIASVRRHLEDVLADGERVERGVPCMAPSCQGPNGGRRLIRKLHEARDPANPKGPPVWVHGDWHCPGCRRRYGDLEYRHMVAAANVRAQRETVPVRRDVLQLGDGGLVVDDVETTWASIAYAASVVERPEATIRSWIHRGTVATSCVIAGRRTGFVSLDDVFDRHTEAAAREHRALLRVLDHLGVTDHDRITAVTAAANGSTATTVRVTWTGYSGEPLMPVHKRGRRTVVQADGSHGRRRWSVTVAMPEPEYAEARRLTKTQPTPNQERIR